MSLVGKWIKQTVVQLYKRILVSDKKEGALTPYKSVDESFMHNTK